MRTTMILLYALLFSMHAFTQTEEKTIKKVIEQETAAFFKHDFKTSFSYWHVMPQSVAIVSHLNGEVNCFTGKELNAAFAAKQLGAADFPDNVERSGWKLRINANSAYITFSQATFKNKEALGQTYESRYMEKISGQWKIIAMYVVDYKK